MNCREREARDMNRGHMKKSCKKRKKWERTVKKKDGQMKNPLIKR